MCNRYGITTEKIDVEAGTRKKVSEKEKAIVLWNIPNCISREFKCNRPVIVVRDHKEWQISSNQRIKIV